MTLNKETKPLPLYQTWKSLFFLTFCYLSWKSSSSSIRTHSTEFSDPLSPSVLTFRCSPRKGSLMKTQTQLLDNKLYYTRKIELHRKGKKSRTVRITPILICLSGSEISALITVRRVHYSKMGKVPITHSITTDRSSWLQFNIRTELMYVSPCLCIH